MAENRTTTALQGGGRVALLLDKLTSLRVRPAIAQSSDFTNLRHHEFNSGSIHFDSSSISIDRFRIGVRNDKSINVPQAETKSSQFTAHRSLKKAFTLAEVLITLGIIGVVSVLTLPNLMADYNKKVYVTQLQRTINIMSSAAQNYMLDNFTDNITETASSDANFSENFVTKYLGCPKAIDKTDIFEGISYKFIDGTVTNSNIFKNISDDDVKSCGTTSTGAIVCIKIYNNPPFDFDIVVDVNGKSSPNIIGRDFFRLGMKSEGAVMNMDLSYYKPEICGTTNDSWNVSAACFNKIVEDGWKMNY